MTWKFLHVFLRNILRLAALFFMLNVTSEERSALLLEVIPETTSDIFFFFKRSCSVDQRGVSG